MFLGGLSPGSGGVRPFQIEGLLLASLWALLGQAASLRSVLQVLGVGSHCLQGEDPAFGVTPGGAWCTQPPVWGAWRNCQISAVLARGPGSEEGVTLSPAPSRAASHNLSALQVVSLISRPCGLGPALTFLSLSSSLLPPARAPEARRGVSSENRFCLSLPPVHLSICHASPHPWAIARPSWSKHAPPQLCRPQPVTWVLLGAGCGPHIPAASMCRLGAEETAHC